MPQRDRTGPAGEGPMTGMRFGACAEEGGRPRGCGRGLGMRRGFGRGCGCGCGGRDPEEFGPKTEKERLQEQKKRLELRLKEINKKLEEG